MFVSSLCPWNQQPGSPLTTRLHFKHKMYQLPGGKPRGHLKKSITLFAASIPRWRIFDVQGGQTYEKKQKASQATKFFNEKKSKQQIFQFRMVLCFHILGCISLHGLASTQNHSKLSWCPLCVLMIIGSWLIGSDFWNMDLAASRKPQRLAFCRLEGVFWQHCQVQVRMPHSPNATFQSSLASWYKTIASERLPCFLTVEELVQYCFS